MFSLSSVHFELRRQFFPRETRITMPVWNGSRRISMLFLSGMFSEQGDKKTHRISSATRIEPTHTIKFFFVQSKSMQSRKSNIILPP
mmetsp:Transcript_6907/g.15645  ORF Transcript_6907/g.15645 Transcript_6907/m.15645 type:complete len:87 (+) Transcript_6907:260-520(+)